MVKEVLKRFTDDTSHKIDEHDWGVRHPNLNFWGVRTPTDTVAALLLFPINRAALVWRMANEFTPEFGLHQVGSNLLYDKIQEIHELFPSSMFVQFVDNV